jgi:hypothetical protein
MQQEPRQECGDLPREQGTDLVTSKTSHAFLWACQRFKVRVAHRRCAALVVPYCCIQGLDAMAVFTGGLKLIGPYQAIALDCVLSVSVIKAIPVSAPGSSPKALTKSARISRS